MFRSFGSLCRVASPTALRVHSFLSLVMAVFASKMCWSLLTTVLASLASQTLLRVRVWPARLSASHDLKK